MTKKIENFKRKEEEEEKMIQQKLQLILPFRYLRDLSLIVTYQTSERLFC